MIERPFFRRFLLCGFLAAACGIAFSSPTTAAAPPAPLQAPASGLEADLAALRKAPHLADAALLSRIAETHQATALTGLVEVYRSGVAPYVQLLILRVLPRFDGLPTSGNDAAELLTEAAVGHPFKEVRDVAFRGLAAMPANGPAWLRMIVDSTADDASRVRALKAHVAFGRADDLAWYDKLYEDGLGEPLKGAASPAPRGKGEPELAAPTPLDSLRPVAFEAIKSGFSEERLRKAFGSRFPDVRRAALEELANRGVDDLKQLVVGAFENQLEATPTRVWAAKRALALEGEKFADEIADEATRKVTGPILRDGLAEVLRDARGEAIDKLVRKRFGKGKEHDYLFDLIVAREHWDPKLERALLKLIKHKDADVAERAAQLAYELGLEAAGPVIHKEFERGDEPARRARLLPLLALHETDAAAWRARLVDLATNGETEVSVAAVRLLVGFGPAEIGALTEALASPRSVVRIAAADALTRVAKDDGGVTVYRRVIDELMQRLAKEGGRVELELTDDLFALTGKSFGPRGAAWVGWWENEGRANFKVPTAAELGIAKEQALERRLGSQTASAFFGIQIRSNRLIFIIDVSGSMEAQTRNRYENVKGMPRIQRAQEELIKCLAGLGPESFFNILPFSDKVRPWESALTQCTPEAYEEAKEFTEDLKPSGGTNLVGSLDAAFADPEVDTIFVLSDGEPTMGWTNHPLEIREHIRRLNANRGIQIHAVSIGSSLKILEWLAADSGGEYRAFP